MLHVRMWQSSHSLVLTRGKRVLNADMVVEQAFSPAAFTPLIFSSHVTASLSAMTPASVALSQK